MAEETILPTAAVQESAPAVTGGGADIVTLAGSETSLPSPVSPEAEKSPTILSTQTLQEQAPINTPEPVDTIKTEPEGEIKEEASQSEQAPLPTYEFTLPEGYTNDNEELKKFTTLLGEFEVGTKDRESVQKFGQELVNRHVEELQKTVDRLNNDYIAAWEKQKNDWAEEVKKDSEIGGNRYDTSVGNAYRAIQTYGGTAEQQTQFLQLMETTGLGSHPAVIRLLSNIMEARPVPQPLPGTKPAPSAKSKPHKLLYGG